MIIKETDRKILNDKYKKSGFEAEKQMGFYLKRAFADEEYVYVINDLRINIGEEYAQIDHLVIHQYGFVIIESKSVTDKICVNRYEEWKRIYNNKEAGIPSPIKQAKRQIEILKKFLMSKDSSELYRENFINKLAPKSIEKFHYDVLVAISDSGIIQRDDIELSEICKADSITERIEDLHKQHKKEFYKVLNINAVHFHKDDIAKLANLLVSSHSPIHKVKEVKKEIITPKIKAEQPRIMRTKKPLGSQSRAYAKNEIYSCRYCKSPNLEIKNGQYGYYFKCLFCNKNTKLKLVCSTPTKECTPILEKRGLEFYRKCKGCGEEKLFFTNIKKEVIPKKEIIVKKENISIQSHQCNKCKSVDVQIAYGKYGYYYKCQSCHGNSKIPLKCTKTSCKPKLKKEKEKFYQVCSDCDTKEIFFTNKA